MATEFGKYAGKVEEIYADEAAAVEKAEKVYALAVRAAEMSVVQAQNDAHLAVVKAAERRDQAIERAKLATPAALAKQLPMDLKQTVGGHLELRLVKGGPVFASATAAAGDEWRIDSPAGVGFVGSKEAASRQLVAIALNEGYVLLADPEPAEAAA